MAHTSISVNSSGDLILNVATATGGYYAVTKTQDGFAVAGYYTYGENLVGIILAGAETPEATYMSGINGGNTTTMTYNDTTVYYNYYLYDLYGKTFDLEKTEASSGVAYYLGYYETHPEDMSTIATTLLDYYYSGDDVIKKVSKDFQNGFALGLACGGIVDEKILDHTVKFMVEGEPYEVVSVKDGNSINSPLAEPTSVNGFFAGWQTSEGLVGFPYTPTEDVDLIANFDAKYYSNKLYEHFGVSQTEYPYVVIEYSTSSRQLMVMFSKTMSQNEERFLVVSPYLYTYKSSVTFSDITTENVVDKCLATLPTTLGTNTTSRGCYGGESIYYWVNKTLNYPYENHNLYYF